MNRYIEYMNEMKGLQIREATADILTRALELLHQLEYTLEWGDHQEYKENIFLIALLGYVITTKQHKETLLKYSIELSNIIDNVQDFNVDDNDILDQALKIINNAKDSNN
jgi:hypothetical protein